MAAKADHEINSVRPEDHLPLVMHFAKKMGAGYHVIDSEQYADGCVGLVRACQLYDPNRINPKTGCPAQFSTYAARAIIGAIHKVHKEKHTQRRGGGMPTSLFSDSGVPFDSVPQRDSEGPDPEDAALCDNMLKRLDARTASFVRAAVMNGETLLEIARREHMSKERVRQIIAAGLDRLRASEGLPPRKYKRWKSNKKKG